MVKDANSNHFGRDITFKSLRCIADTMKDCVGGVIIEQASDLHYDCQNDLLDAGV